MIPGFNRHGLLPRGVHRAKIIEIKKRFGSSNFQRRMLFSGLMKALINLAEAGVKKVYIDGSFVTDKDYPKDIDGCWEPSSTIDLGIIDPVFLLDSKSSRDAMKKKYGVDFFPAAWTESGSGYPFTLFFQRNRGGREKGIIVVEIGDELIDKK